MRSPSSDLGGGLAAHGGGDDGLEVGHGQAVAGNGGAINGDLDLGLAEQQVGADVGGAGDRLDDLDDLVGVWPGASRIVAEQLDGQLAFDAGNGLVDVVLDVLAELAVMPGISRRLRAMRVAQPVARAGGFPLLARLGVPRCIR